MKFFCVKNNLYPLIAVFSSVAILIFGLVNAKSIECTYFLIGVFLWMFIFGFYKQAIKAFIMFVVIGGIFACFTLKILPTPLVFIASRTRLISALKTGKKDIVINIPSVTLLGTCN